MKKIKLIALSIVLLATFSCKQTNKTEVSEQQTTEKEETKQGAYSVVKDSTVVSFKAYKFTEKTPVGGEFTKINLLKITEGDTPFETMDGTEFNIPVSSLFTNDPTEARDPKIIEFFFGKMINTGLISGVFKVAEDSTCSVDITLNGTTNNIPLEYTSDNDTHFSFDGVMNLEDWDALDALESLHKACELLHTGADGVSKTWSEVAVHAEVLLKKN